jgi:hypothetical protein
VTIKPIAKGLDKAGFSAYLAGEATEQLVRTTWRPRGVVLHNTGYLKGPTWNSTENFYFDAFHGNRPMSGADRVKNTWQTYIAKGWSGGPHLMLTDREIYLANPLWLPGTHSPSWNASFWGLEMAGDYDIEPFTPKMRDLVTYALAALYSLLGHEPDEATFRLHYEDPLTAHKPLSGQGTRGQKAAGSPT